MRVCIVRPDGAPWLVGHAAEELARYVTAMTDAETRLVPRYADRGAADVTIVLAAGAAADELRRLPGADDPGRLRDGFLIRSGGQNRLKIAAVEPAGLLYGVYQYLERHCGVGFFWDGDHIPRRADLPVDGINDAELPRWPVRHFGLSSCFGLAKWHHQFRTPEERERILDWMAKRRINRSHHCFSPTIAASGVSAQRVFGISDREPDNFTFAGWPGCLDFPAEVRTRIIKDQLDYGRRRGIEWIYYLAYGNVPHQFRQMHPEYRYVDQLGYSATVLYPTDPEGRRWTGAFYRDLIETYGTDHLYVDSPFVESAGATDPEASFTLKLNAAQQMCGLFRELDPQATWGSDSWDFGALPQVWTPERIDRYYAALPREMMLVYDTAGLENPFYQRTGYFHRTPWAFGILHSFQGDDHLHGDVAHALSAIQELSQDPAADKCVGIYHVPETSGHNVLFFDLTTQLAWQPEGVTLDGFLGDYVRRRYGRPDAERMLPAVTSVVDAVYRGGGQMPIYRKLGCGYGTWWWPIVDEHKRDDDPLPAIVAAAQGLREALVTASACRDTQAGNALYENDMVDWARTYLAHIFNWAVLDAYRAFGEGDAERVRRSAGLARECLGHLEAILSTRPDFALQPQIDRCTSVPGANPYLAWYMKQHCINDLYSANEVYEQLHWYYGPRMEVYLSELESRAAAGTRTIAWADIADRCQAIQDRWLNEDIRVPEGEHYGGEPLDAVEAAVRAVGVPGSGQAGAVPGRGQGSPSAKEWREETVTAEAAGQLETERLVIRRFRADDWADVLELARDKESSEGGKYDHAWPTSEEGCKGAARYFSTHETFWAVCLKDGGRVIGLLALSPEEEPDVMEVGHVFHTGFVSDDLDTEALRCIMDHAFTDLGAERIICRNAEEWTLQLAPLRKLGLRVEGRGDGTDFFQRDADGNPITFVGCTMSITRQEWLRRRPRPTRQ